MTVFARFFLFSSFGVCACAAGDSPLSYIFEREHEIVPVGRLGGASSVAAADFNGDGHMDIAAAAVDADIVGIWLNNSGDGKDLQQKILQTPFDGAYVVSLVDIDKDGDMDVLACGNEGQVDSLYSGVHVWENLKNVAWKGHPVAPKFSIAQAVSAGDVDGDGDVDVVVAGENGVSWFEQDSLDDWIEHAVGEGRSGTGIAAADFNGDGKADIVTGFWTDDTLKLYIGSANGREFKEVSISEDYSYPSFIYALDMDGDNDMDILSTSYGKGRVSFWENVDGKGTFGEHVVTSELRGAFGVHAGDIDGDGDLDIAACGKSSGEVWWYEQDGRTWKPHLVQNDFVYARSVWIADMDGDGDLDLIGASQGKSQLRWWENRMPKKP